MTNLEDSARGAGYRTAPAADSLVKRLLIGAILLATAGGAGAYYWQQQETKRQLLELQERERVAEEARAVERAAAAKRREDILVAEAAVRREEEVERLRVAREQREAEMKNEQYVAGKAYVPNVKSQAEIREERRQLTQEYRETLVRNWDERLRRIESDRELSKAQAAVDRQKLFLERQRYEEDLAARQREFASKRAEKAGR